MRIFNSYVRIERNNTLERQMLLNRNVMPARRLSTSNAMPSLPVSRPMRRNSLMEPPRGQVLLDANFAQWLHANVNRDEDPNGKYIVSELLQFLRKNTENVFFYIEKRTVNQLLIVAIWMSAWRSTMTIAAKNKLE